MRYPSSRTGVQLSESGRSSGPGAPVLSLEDEIRAANALVSSFFKLNEVGETRESKRIEEYLQRIGDKVAQRSTRTLTYKFHLDPHPGFRSAVAYPGGQIIVGEGVLALMEPTVMVMARLSISGMSSTNM
jgi:predicted Zn-dependent protease